MDDWSRYRELVKALPYGKVLPTAIYIHRGERVCKEGYLGQMLSRVSEQHKVGEEFNVVKFRTDAPRLSLLRYPAFFEEAHPCLEEAIAIDLTSGRCLRTSYRDSLNPPILHRKELMLGPDHPQSGEFAALSAAEEQAGLYLNTAVIGFRVNWDRLLAARDLVIDGHTLVHRTGDATARVNGFAVHRHKTALTRYQLSRPVKTLIEHSQLLPTSTFFDYGCGLGGDVRGLAELGFNAKGWDPVHAPNALRAESDVVNLGYVLNVIEDPAERLETLSSAWQLAKRLLVVSAQIGSRSNEAGKAATFNDGILTQRNTFQKYFAQQELQSYLEDALEVPALPVALGIFYVFRDPSEHQAFLQSRSRRKVDWESVDAGLSKPVRPPREPRAARRRVRPDPMTEQFELVERFWSVTLHLGRIPASDEFEWNAEICAVFGTAKRALRMLLARKGPELFDRAQAARKSDLLVYLATSHLRKSIPFGHLPEGVRIDIAVFFGTYSRGLIEGRQLLHSAADPSTVVLACDEAVVGWQDERSLYVRSSHVGQLPTVLRTLIACAELLYGDIREADIIRIHKYSGKVTFLSYSNFQSTFPQLTTRTKVDLRAARVDVFDHTDDRQLLCFKERFLDADDPAREQLVLISDTLRRLGVSDSNFLGPSAFALRQRLLDSGEAGLACELGLNQPEWQ